MTLYADDPDAHVDYAITDTTGGTNDYAPTITTGAVTITPTWQTPPAPTRTLRVPLTVLDAGSHNLRLVIPGGNDLNLGRVFLY